MAAGGVIFLEQQLLAFAEAPKASLVLFAKLGLGLVEVEEALSLFSLTLLPLQHPPPLAATVPSLSAGEGVVQQPLVVVVMVKEEGGRRIVVMLLLQSKWCTNASMMNASAAN